MLHCIRQRTKAYCSVRAVAMSNVPIHSYSLAPRNNYVYQEVGRSESVNYVLGQNTDLQRNPSECHSRTAKHTSRDQHKRIKPTQLLWLLDYCEWMNQEWLSLPQSIPGTWARAEQTEGTATCAVTYPVQLVCFHQLTSQHSEVREAFFFILHPNRSSEPYTAQTAPLWQCVPAHYFQTFSLKNQQQQIVSENLSNRWCRSRWNGLKAFTGCTQKVPRRICESSRRHLEQRKSYRPHVHYTLLPSCASSL
jgi:hypothetical protein